MQRIFRFQFRKLLVEIAGLGKVALLHISVSEQLHHLIHVRGVPGLLQQAQHQGQRFRAAADAADQGINRVVQYIGTMREKTVSVAFIQLECRFQATIRQIPLGQRTDAAEVMMDGEELAGQRFHAVCAARPQLGFQQRAQSIGA